MLVPNCTFNNLPGNVMKGDECNTNVVSRRHFEQIWNSFRAVEGRCVVKYSREASPEVSSNVILNGTLQSGSHVCTSN